MVGFSESWKDYRRVEVQLLLLVFPPRFPCCVKGSIVGKQAQFPPITQFLVNGQWVGGANIIAELHAGASVVTYLKNMVIYPSKKFWLSRDYPPDRPPVRPQCKITK